jgi:hypothetical protein
MKGLLVAVIGGAGLLAFLEMRHGTISAGISGAISGVPALAPPYMAAPPQLAFGGQVVDNLAMEGVGVASDALESSLAKSGSSLASAIPFIGTAISSIVGGLLAAHQARLQGATTENQQVAKAVPSFYQTAIAIVNAWNAGRISRADAINGWQQLDQATYTALRQFVGKPGTAWNSSASGVCDKTCTVGCCIYNTWLHPDIVGTSGRRGVAAILAGGPSSPIWSGGKKGFGGIPTNKYNFPGYPSVTVTLRAP